VVHTSDAIKQYLWQNYDLYRNLTLKNAKKSLMYYMGDGLIDNFA